MKAIWKFQIESSTKYDLPQGSEILYGDFQEGKTYVWAAVNPEELDTETYRVSILGTGETVDEFPGQYLNTVLTGPYVWHFFVEKLS